MSDLVKDLEDSLESYKRISGPANNVVGNNLYRYESIEETGYILAPSVKLAKEKVDIPSNARIHVIIKAKDLELLLINKHVISRLLPF